MTYHNYIFFTIDPTFQDISDAIRAKYKKEFLRELTSDKHIVSNTYATLGLKTNTNILIWFQADSIDIIQSHLNRLMHTHLGRYLRMVHTLFGMTRPTQYSRSSTVHLDTNRKGGAYLVIYPFTKTKEWHMLDLEKRKQLMSGHMAIGRAYPQISQLLLYSYGVDDSEFIVSYEMDDLPAFQSLVMELRADSVRMYTLKDTPIFTCIHKTQEEVLGYL